MIIENKQELIEAVNHLRKAKRELVDTVKCLQRAADCFELTAKELKENIGDIEVGISILEDIDI